MLGEYELLVYQDDFRNAPHVMLRVAMTWNPDELNSIFKPWESRYAKTYSLPFQSDCSNVKNFKSWLMNSRAGDAFYLCVSNLANDAIKLFFGKGLVTHHWLTFYPNDYKHEIELVLYYLHGFLSGQLSEGDFKKFFLEHLNNFSIQSRISGNKYDPMSNDKLQCRKCSVFLDFVEYIRSMVHRFNPSIPFEMREAQRMRLLADILDLSQSYDSRFIEYGK